MHKDQVIPASYVCKKALQYIKIPLKNYSSKCILQNTLLHPSSYTWLIHEVAKAQKV